MAYQLQLAVFLLEHQVSSDHDSYRALLDAFLVNAATNPTKHAGAAPFMVVLSFFFMSLGDWQSNKRVFLRCCLEHSQQQSASGKPQGS